MSQTIFIISGFSDIEIVGNQSMKNGIKYLSESGYKIQVFSCFPRDYHILENPKSVFLSNVEFHRLPAILSPFIYAGKKIRDLLARKKGHKEQIQKLRPSQPVGYHDEFSFFMRLSYMVFLFLFYVTAESVRVTFYHLKHRADIFYGINSQGVIVASILGRIFNRPVITRFHGTTLREQDLRTFKTRFLFGDEIMALKANCDAVIMANDGTRGDEILKKLDVNEKKIHFWMNGLDVDDLMLPDGWDPHKFRDMLGLNGKKLLLMASRLALWKRIDRGIYCVNKLLKEYEMADVVLLVIGEGSQMNILESQAENSGVKEAVRFLGGVPHREMAKYYAIADVFLSLYDVSNLGNPLLEAMHFGLPIVTIDDGSTAHILENGRNAFLIKIEDLEDTLPLKVKMLLENESLRREMGQNALATARKNILTWEDRMRLEDRLIKTLIR